MKGYEPTIFQTSQVGRICTATVGIRWPDGRTSREAASSERSMSEAVRRAVVRTIDLLPDYDGKQITWQDIQIDTPVDIDESQGQFKCKALVSVCFDLSEGSAGAYCASLDEAYFRAIVAGLNQAFAFDENEPVSGTPKVGRTIGV